MRPYARILSIASLLVIGACQPSEEDIANGDDPVRALSATVPSTRYAQAYWVQQSENRSEVWQRARATCQNADLGERPNCSLVQEIADFDDMVERSRNRVPSGPATIDAGWNRPGGAQHTLPAAAPDSSAL